MQRALRGAGGSNVPCDGCTACCRSSQFIDIAPDETDTLVHVPAELLFPAPGRPAGHVVLGYDETGCCPMLIDNRCSIYEHRPQTCRTYDCRVLTAARVELDDETKALIAERTQRWRFGYPNPDDRARQRAVRDRGRVPPPERTPTPGNTTRRAGDRGPRLVPRPGAWPVIGHRVERRQDMGESFGAFDRSASAQGVCGGCLLARDPDSQRAEGAYKGAPACSATGGRPPSRASNAAARSVSS